jgi:hypothetical protein
LVSNISPVKQWSVEQADALVWLKSLPVDSVDLVFGSPPYAMQRVYFEDGQDLGIARDVKTWATWMADVYEACLRVCTGLTAFVVAGSTKNYAWDGAPARLIVELLNRGIALRNPPIYHRVGIPGSGGPDWLRADYETIVCATRGGKLPWSDNTACGAPPKWQPGGTMSYRNTKGERKNVIPRFGSDDVEGGTRDSTSAYKPPKLCNPGNKIMASYTAAEVAGMREENGDIRSHKVGGGLLGHPLAHENEAPFPLDLASFFVRSFCKEGGTVCDPFAGSSSTGHAAILHGRRYLGADVRASQVALSKRRLTEVDAQLGSQQNN